jgi:hypothetical protein
MPADGKQPCKDPAPAVRREEIRICYLGDREL